MFTIFLCIFIGSTIGFCIPDIFKIKQDTANLIFGILTIIWLASAIILANSLLNDPWPDKNDELALEFVKNCSCGIVENRQYFVTEIEIIKNGKQVFPMANYPKTYEYYVKQKSSKKQETEMEKQKQLINTIREYIKQEKENVEQTEN